MSSRKMGYIFPKKIQDAMHGEQTHLHIGGYYERNTKTDHAIGEEFTESDGTKWIQKDGYKSKVGKLDDVRIDLHTCPVCKRFLRTRLDINMMTLTNKCFECVLKEENEMRANGTYEQYEKEKMKQNAISFYTDAKNSLISYLDDIRERTSIDFVESDGHIEKWSLDDKEKIIEFCEKELKDIENTLHKINTGEYENEEDAESTISSEIKRIHKEAITESIV